MIGQIDQSVFFDGQLAFTAPEGDGGAGQGSTAFDDVPATITRLAGVDLSAELLSMGRPKLNGVSFPVELISRSAEILPFDDRSFDTVVVTWPTSGVSFSVGPTHVIQLGTSNNSTGIYFGGKS